MNKHGDLLISAPTVAPSNTDRPGFFATLARAGLFTAAATLATIALNSRSDRIDYELFYLAVLLATFFYGRRTGLLTIAISFFVCAFLFTSLMRNIGPASFTQRVQTLPPLVLFLLIDGTLVWLIGVLRNAQEEQRIARTRLEHIVATAPCIIYSFQQRLDGSSRFVFASPGIEDIFGIEFNELEKDAAALFDRIDPRDIGHVRESIERSRVQLTPFFDIFRFHHLTKGEVWIQGHAIPQSQADGSTLWHGNLHDDTERKAFEEKMKLFRALVDGANDSIEVVDAQTGRFIDFNQKACEQNGYSREELLSMTIQDISPEVDQARLLKNAKTLRQGKPICFEVAHRRKDGSTFPVEVNVNLVKLDREYLVASVRDISERKRAEAALRESEAFTRTVLDNLPIGIAVHSDDLSKRIGYMNDSFPKFYRTTRDEIAEPDSFWDAVFEDPEFRDAIRKRVLADCASGDAGRMVWSDVPITRKNQETRYITARNILVPEKHLMIAMVWDVTEHKRVEEVHARLATAVEQAAESIVITDTQDTILYVNPAFEKSTGYTREEAIGNKPKILKSGKHDADFYRQLRNTLERGKVWQGHFINRRKDGTHFEEDATISPVRDASGTIVNYVAVKRDISREVQLEAQFRQSQKMEAFGLLAGGVAHDFNNLLGVVLGYCDIWLRKLPPTDKIREPLKAIRGAGERAASLTKQLLAFSRQTVLEPQVLDLNNVVRETEKMLGRLIGEDINLTSIMDPLIPKIRVDPGQIGQVLLNLAVNARDAMPQGGNLTIQTEFVDFDNDDVTADPGLQAGPRVLLSVSDTGCGMPPETVARIFEPFFTTKGVGKGTGLGLAVVHGVVTQSGGTIRVESKVGEGTTFLLYFPPCAETLPAERTSEDKVAHAGKETILLVEDQDNLLELAAESLRMFGYEVLTASRGSDALQLMSKPETRVDLMLTDLVMPGMNGRVLAESLKQIMPNLKVIYMSGYTDDSIVRNGIDHHTVAFLQKPFSPYDLAKKVREVLNAPNPT